MGTALAPGLWQDVRYAARLCRRQPGYALIATLTMALGIGATTTLFSVAYGVLARPLPWPDADRLVRLTETRKGNTGRIKGTITNGTYLSWNDRPSTVEAIGGYFSSTVTAALDAGEPLRLQVGRVTPTLFPLLRARPLRGRLFLPEEGAAGGTGAPINTPVAIVSFGVWQQWFGGRDDAIGRVLQIDGRPFTVIGVMPRDFAFPDRETQLWVPNPIGSVLGEQGGRRMQIFSALARLKPGVTPAQASAEGTARARSAPDPGMTAMALFGSTAPPDITATPAVEAMTAEVRPAILVLLAAVALLLITATANVASLQLARATTRRREMALRAAIGAGAGRLTRQLVVESSMVGLAGGLAGLLLAAIFNRVLPSLLPADFPRLADIAIDGRVLLFAIGLSMAASVAAGLLPAAQARRIDLVEALAEDGAASTGGAWRSRSGRIRSVIMAVQVAVASILLVGAALLGRSFVALMHADRGYDPVNVLTARVDLPSAYTVPRRVAFADAVLDRLSEAPGVTSAAIGNALPFLSMGGSFGFQMPSPRDPAIKVPVQTMTRVVSPEYFSTLRLRIVAGRALADTDTAASRPVIVVNRSFAKRYLAEAPLGARVPMSFGEGKPDCDVVGVVDDMRQGDVTDAEAAEMFISYRQMPIRLTNGSLFVVMRTAGDPVSHVAALRAAVRERDPGLAIDSVMTMEDRVMTSLARPQTYAVLLSAFGVFALLIAGVGLFGVLSYSVAQRSREIGVRTALGAQPRDIVTLVMRQGLAIAVGGMTVGLSLAYALGGYVGSFLYGVTRYDAVSFAIVAATLAMASVVACVVPARRAAQVDPLTVLKAN
ncbi:MAG: ABC transporter permease [Acidobacteria bacterium]|nr:ABC transporter permease [Acidobacteriota bacterium]